MTVTIPLIFLTGWVLMGFITDAVMRMCVRRNEPDTVEETYKKHGWWLLATCIAFWPYCWGLVLFNEIKRWRI